MRAIAAFATLLVGMLPAAAQTTTAKPAPLVRPAMPTAAETYAAMSFAERTSLQSDLVWGSDYNGLVNGEFAERTVASIKAFQKKNKARETGVLNPQERELLSAAAKTQRDAVAWKIVEDPITASRVGLPSKLFPQMVRGKSGTRWISANGEASVETFRLKEPGLTLAAVFDQQKKDPAGRQIEYSLLLPDFFVLSGLQGTKNFYIRGQAKDGEVRGMTVLYDQSIEAVMDKAVVAMSSAFGPAVTTASTTPASPLSKRKVEYGTGIVVSDSGYIVTARHVTDGCHSIQVPPLGNVERVAEDAATDLALLRVYGARHTVPLPFAGEALAGPDLTIVGVPDPQAQGGNGGVSSARTRIAANSALEAAPAAGFSGAAAIDGGNRFFGMVQIKPQVLAGANPTTVPPAATVIPAETVRTFLQAQGVSAVTGRADDAKASVVRIICFRK